MRCESNPAYLTPLPPILARTAATYRLAAPFVHPNGSIYLVFNSDDMVMVRADNWAGPYEVVLHGACGGGEDPFLYVSRAHYPRFHLG